MIVCNLLTILLFAELGEVSGLLISEGGDGVPGPHHRHPPHQLPALRLLVIPQDVIVDKLPILPTCTTRSAIGINHNAFSPKRKTWLLSVAREWCIPDIGMGSAPTSLQERAPGASSSVLSNLLVL